MNKILILALFLVLAFTQGDVVVVPNEEIDNADSPQPGSYEIKDGVVILTDANFKQALQEFDFVLVKFFAPWCGHCKHVAPVLAEVAQALQAANSQAKIAEIDCTIHKVTCQQKGIRGYPTMLWFQKGKDESEKYTSARTTEAFLDWINQRVNSGQENVGEL